MSADVASKPSLLDIAVEKLNNANKKQLIHSVVIVSRLSPGLVDKRDIGLHYEKIFKVCHSKYQGDGPTGIVLVYPLHCVHLVEAPIEVINAIIIDLQDREDLFTLSRILNFSTDIDPSFYTMWAYRVLNLASLPKGEEYQTHDPIEITVSSNIEKLYRLGAQLSKLVQGEMKKTLDALPEKLPDYLIQQDVLEYLVSCEHLNTPQQFVQLYMRTPQTVFDGGKSYSCKYPAKILSRLHQDLTGLLAGCYVRFLLEVVWPIPNKLFPYDEVN